MNYGELKAAVQGWANRGDLLSQMSVFRDLAEQRIYNGTRDLPGLQLSSMLVQNDSFAPGTLPADFIAVERVAWLNAGRLYPLESRSSGELSIYEVAAGNPAWYTIRGGKLIVGPGSASTVQLLYYARLTTPSGDSDTNDILTNSPGVYLYGMLLEVAAWLRDTDMLAQYAPMFADAMKSAQQSDNDARRGTAPLRITSDARVRA